MKINPIHTHLDLAICKDAADAIAKGFDHTAEGANVKPIAVVKVVVVRKGTQSGNPTVDFLLEDESGQRYVFLVTGNLLTAVAGTLA